MRNQRLTIGFPTENLGPNENPEAAATGSGADIDLAKITGADTSDMRTDAQRRLALKLAAGAGLSVALASCFVVLALGQGARE